MSAASQRDWRHFFLIAVGHIRKEATGRLAAASARCWLTIHLIRKHYSNAQSEYPLYARSRKYWPVPFGRLILCLLSTITTVGGTGRGAINRYLIVALRTKPRQCLTGNCQLGRNRTINDGCCWQDVQQPVRQNKEADWLAGGFACV